MEFINIQYYVVFIEPVHYRLWHMRCVIAHACLCTNLRQWRHAKKARLVWLRKLQGVRHITRLKQQRFLSFTFCKTQKSYEEIMCIYLLFYWFSGENCIIRSSHHRCFRSSLFFSKFAGAAVVFTYPLNLKIFEHSL